MKASELAERLMRHPEADVPDVNVVVWFQATNRIEMQASAAMDIPGGEIRSEDDFRQALDRAGKDSGKSVLIDRYTGR